MKHYLIISILNLIFHFGSTSLHSQSTERILKKAISAVGGEKAIEKAKKEDLNKKPEDQENKPSKDETK